MSPGQMGQYLNGKIESISTLLAGSTRGLKKGNLARGLTRLDYCFHVHAYKHVSAKGLHVPAGVIQTGLNSISGDV